MTKPHGGTHHDAHAPVIPTFTIGDRLKKAREHAGLHQDELAARLMVDRKTISKYEADDVQRHTRSTIKQWAFATGVPEEWLKTGEAPAVPEQPDDGGRHPDTGSPTVTYLARFLTHRHRTYRPAAAAVA